MLPKIILPGTHLNQERSAFSRGTKERQLRVLLDRRSLRANPDLDVLLSLRSHPLLWLATTEDDPGIARLVFQHGKEAADVLPFDLRLPDGSWSRGGVYPLSQWERFAREDAASAPNEDLRECLLIAVAAEELHVDALVTGSDYLLRTANRNIVRRSNPLSVEEALSLIGLYLRSRQDFRLYVAEGGSFGVNAGLFYWILARQLLPEGWRWFSACVQHSAASGDDSMEGLGGAALLRFDRALRARDRMQIQLQLPQNNDTADEALFYLDLVLISVSGSFDAVARVAHHVHGLAGDQWSVGWRRSVWRSELASRAPALAQLTDIGTPARDVIELTARLRNTIHGEALRSVAFQEGAHDLETLVEIPATEQPEILNSVSRLGGEPRWGVRRLAGGRVMLEADRFVECLIAESAAALCALMAATPVETLQGVALPLPSGPPSNDVWSPEIRRAISLLGGFP